MHTICNTTILKGEVEGLCLAHKEHKLLPPDIRRWLKEIEDRISPSVWSLIQEYGQDSENNIFSLPWVPTSTTVDKRLQALYAFCLRVWYRDHAERVH